MKPLLLLLFGTVVAFAQPFAVGVRGGVPLTDFINTVKGPNPSLDSFGAKTNRYIVGPTAELYLPFGFGVEFDALYRHLNYNVHGEVIDLITNGRTTGNAWEFPLLAKYRFPIPGIKPFVDGGVSFDTLRGLKQTITSALASGITNTTTSHPAELRHNTIFGVVVGGGLDIRLASLHLLPEIRYMRWNSGHFRALTIYCTGTRTIIGRVSAWHHLRRRAPLVLILLGF